MEKRFDIRDGSNGAAAAGDGTGGPTILNLSSHGAGASALARLIETGLWSRSSVRVLLCDRLLLQKLLPVQALHFVIAMLAQLPALIVASTTTNAGDGTSDFLAHGEATRGDGCLVALGPATLRLVQLWGNDTTLTQLPTPTQVWSLHGALDVDSVDEISLVVCNRNSSDVAHVHASLLTADHPGMHQSEGLTTPG